jgi:hypothetical protein
MKFIFYFSLRFTVYDSMLILRVKNKFLEKKNKKSFKAFLSPKNATVSLSVFAERENAFKHPFFFPRVYIERFF